MKRLFSFTLLFIFCVNLGFSLEITTNTALDFPKLQLSGYTQVRYTADETPGNKDGFSLGMARFGVKGNISTNVSYAFSLEKTNTDTTNSKELYDLYIDVKSIPYFSARIGQFKYEFSLEQCTPDADLELINKSGAVKTLVSPTRDIGIEIARVFSLFSVKTDIALTLVNGSGSNTSDENDPKTAIGRIVFSPFQGLDFGGSVYDGETSTKTIKTRVGLELKYEIKNFFTKAEYLHGKDASVQSEGFYLTGGFTLFPSLVLLLRYDVWDASLKTIGKKESRLTIGVNYFLDKNVLIRNNYEMKQEDPSKDNNLLMTQLQVKF